MLRFIITVVLGAALYTVATAIDLVLAPGDDNLAILSAPIVGVIFTAIVITLVVLPVRAVFRRLRPGASQRSHAVVSAGLLCALVTVFSLVGSRTTFTAGRLSFWALWTCYSLSVTASFCWPLAAQSKSGGD
jgi:hypothetical protein